MGMKGEEMSLILKGIDLPTDRKPYGIEVIYRFEGADGLFSEKNYLSPNQAVQISKDHGRLIDGDKIQDKAYERYFNNTISSYGLFEVNRAIEDAPTILEAEENE